MKNRRTLRCFVAASLVSALAVLANAPASQASPGDGPTDTPAARAAEQRLQSTLKEGGTYAVAGDEILVSAKQLKSTPKDSEEIRVVRAASGGTPPWRPCGLTDSKNKELKVYGRQTMKGVSGKSARLRCGHHNFLKKTGLGVAPHKGRAPFAMAGQGEHARATLGDIRELDLDADADASE